MNTMIGVPELSVSDAVATIELRRPNQANRLTADDLAVLADHIAAVNCDPSILVLRLQATGKYFCSGYDISSIGQARKVSFDAVVNALEDARPVTIAVMHGGVYGGATDLALACDFRLGVKGMEMFMPAARLGLHFYQRGMERYVSRLGLDTAKRLFLTAEKLSADEMKSVGFLTDLVTPEQLASQVVQLTATLVGMAPLALTGMKKNLNRMATGRLDQQELEQDIAKAYSSADLKEGQAAWAEKRTPRFAGR